MLRDYAGFSFGGITRAREEIQETADGRLLLITHGDAFDGVVLYARWLAFLGDHTGPERLSCDSGPARR